MSATLSNGASDPMPSNEFSNAPVAVVEAIIRDVPAQTQYMYMCEEASLVNTPEFKSGVEPLPRFFLSIGRWRESVAVSSL